MSRRIREYHRPTEVAEAATLWQREQPVTGATLVGPRAPDEPYLGIEAVVDLTRLGLDQISETPDGQIQIGAAVSLQALADSPLLQALADGVLAEAARLSAGSALRNAATVGGLLAYAREAAQGTQRDGPPEVVLALQILGARVRLASAEAAPLGDYLRSQAFFDAELRRSAPGEVGRLRTPKMPLVLYVEFAKPEAGTRASLQRLARTPRDQALVAAAAAVSGQEVGLAVAPGGTAPLRLEAIEATLTGATASDETLQRVERDVAAAVAPLSDFRASAEYRRAMAGVLARRALAEALRRARGR
jgi:CO/xanthine dehydrogenase FAD-binding subunit